jgi:hypothetical protein
LLRGGDFFFGCNSIFEKLKKRFFIFFLKREGSENLLEGGREGDQKSRYFQKLFLVNISFSEMFTILKNVNISLKNVNILLKM